MNHTAWQPAWTPEVEAAWTVGLSTNDVDPGASIRHGNYTIASTLHRAADPHQTEESQAGNGTFVAAPAKRRRMVVSDAGKPGEPDASSEYDLIEQIGAGGMGRVFRAKQSSLNREIAIKRLHERDPLPDAIAHFESEARITAILDHPNIVPVHDIGIDQQGRIFYGMKLIRGRPWHKLLHRRAPGSVTAAPGTQHDLRSDIEILLKVAQALAFAHSKQIIHRDIKPHNVMVGDFGEVLLVDWGLAVSLQPVDPSERIFDLSQVIITCGTPAYMPPEIATDQRPWVGTWTDVYMLGAVLFEVLYGFAPHRQPTVVDALRSASRNAWQFPAEISDRLRPYHEVFKPLLMRAMSGHPHERQLDAAAFADAIKTSLQHLDSAELSTEAASIYHEVECEEATAQQARQANLAVSIRSPQERYRAIAHAIALLGRALDRWPENPAARHYLVEAHLLHAHSSLLAGDLTLAQTHLEALQRLPEAWRPSPEQAQRAQPLYRRLQEAFDGQRRRRQTMTALQLGAAVLTLTIIVGSTVAMVLIDRARDQVETERNHLSKMLISTASDGIASELNRLLDPVRGALDASAQWAKAGHFDTDDPQALNSILIPLIDGFPVMSGIMRADDKGYEYMLLRTEYGWRSRSRAPDRPARFQKLDHGGEVLQTWTETIEYDPLTRPWYKGALNVAPGPDKANAIFWSEPYTFFSTQQPGVTASIAVESAKGRNFVFGIDLSLAEISAFTMKMPDSQHGKVFVLDANKRLIGLPRSGNLSTDEAIRGAFLAPVSSLGDPILDATMSQWSKLSDAQDRAFRVEASGQGWWAGFRSFALGGERSFWIGVISPETDFVGKDTPSTPQAVGQAGAPQ